ncbi:hypothetical protein ASZ90_004238 [hydrocarbon metagenome]|uniref:LIM zinc-binding domain-containing protein n=1 Tax=hydrocarbon metagenome TaxID=938273 RepID=A0A0W8FYJ2_9ZZZZ
MITCYNCNEEIHSDEERYYSDYAYCETCFDDLFTYCDRCDRVLERDSASYNDDGAPYCEECYFQSYDDDFPSNPIVDQSDRELVIMLGRNYLFGKNHKMPISINSSDQFLAELREAVGLRSKSIYVYGLADRDEYQIKVSRDLLPIVEAFQSKHLPEYKIIEDDGKERLGISLAIRLNHFGLITKLIKEEICAE